MGIDKEQMDLFIDYNVDQADCTNLIIQDLLEQSYIEKMVLNIYFRNNFNWAKIFKYLVEIIEQNSRIILIIIVIINSVIIVDFKEFNIDLDFIKECKYFQELTSSYFIMSNINLNAYYKGNSQNFIQTIVSILVKLVINNSVQLDNSINPNYFNISIFFIF